jgi:Gas vesicle protein
MRGKFVTGAIIGAAIGMMVVPQLDRNTRKKINKSSRVVKGMAGEIYDSMMKWGR